MFDFNKWSLKWKLITSASYFKEKNLFFFLQKIEFFAKNVFFLHQFFSELEPMMKNFKKLSSDLNKQGLKWKLIISASYFEEKIWILCSENFSFHKTCKFLTSIFFLIFWFSANIYVRLLWLWIFEQIFHDKLFKYSKLI